MSGGGPRGSSGRTTVVRAPSYEDRKIVVAQGVQFHNDELPTDWRTPEYLVDQIGSDVNVSADGVATYTNHVQRVRFTIEVVNQKDKLWGALSTPTCHVVYAGHARYGRGPCFGSTDGPGEHWENGWAPVNGLFRMGYPFLQVPVTEILEHGYTANLVQAGRRKPRWADCHPDVRAVYSRLRRFTIPQLDPTGGIKVSGSPAATDRFWGVDKYSHGRLKRHALLHAGWTGTLTDPFDLGATDLRCRVFCHFGCSTFKHNYRVLRVFKNWRRSSTDRFAYWTTATAYADIARYWLYHILTYPRRNAFQSWAPSIQYAVRKTNIDLRGDGRSYRII